MKIFKSVYLFLFLDSLCVILIEFQKNIFVENETLKCLFSENYYLLDRIQKIRKQVHTQFDRFCR